jgi:hypothetical protein
MLIREDFIRYVHELSMYSLQSMIFSYPVIMVFIWYLQGICLDTAILILFIGHRSFVLLSFRQQNASFHESTHHVV